MSQQTGATRAVIYARYSSDLQSDRSIEDQVALCKTYAARERLTITDTYSDRAQSGASLIGRDGMLALLADAKRGLFDVVIVEALDRISRDMEDLAGIHKRLSFAGIEIRAVHDGKADAVQVGLRGLMGSIFLADLAHKVRRGLQGVVRDGRSAGGRAYGYRTIPGKPGELDIHEAEAEIVRRIFAEYIAGENPRDIAAGLNRDKVAPPRGDAWNASTINGSQQRNNGMLLNEIYRGQIVWNRVRMVKDPDTGRRVSRINPRDQWQTVAAPQLRIISDEVWQAAQDRRAERAVDKTALSKPKTYRLLSGLLKCAACGSGMASVGKIKGRVKIMCSRSRESGTCDNLTRFDLGKVEARVLDALQRAIRHPALIEEYVRAYIEKRQELARAATWRVEKNRQRLGEANRAMERMVDAIAAGHDFRPLMDRMRTLEDEIQTLRADIARADEQPAIPAILPSTARQYADDLAEAARLAFDGSEEIPTRLRSSLHRLIDRVVVSGGNPPGVEIIGKLSALAEFPLPFGEGGAVVAGARFSSAPLPEFRLVA